MPDSNTGNYQLVLPQIGASRDTWGQKINANLIQIDGLIKVATDTAQAAVPKAGGTMTGDLSIIKSADAVLTLEDTGAPTNTYRSKSIRSSVNVDGGNAFLFRASRPSDGATNDYLLGGPTGTIWTSGNLTPSNYGLKSGSNTWTGPNSFNALSTFTGGINFTGSNSFQGSAGVIGQGYGNLAPLEVRSTGGGNDAYMQFHVPGNYATYFGLGTDAQWYYGGWSEGSNVKWKFWTSKNFNPANHGALASANTWTQSNTFNAPVGIPTASIDFGTSTRQMLNLNTTAYGLGVQDNTLYYRSNNLHAFYSQGTHSNVYADAGGGTALLFMDSNSVRTQVPLKANGNIKLEQNTSSPLIQWNVPNSPSENKQWDSFTNGDSWFLRTVNDACTAANIALQVSRSGTTPTQLYFGGSKVRMGNSQTGENSYGFGYNTGHETYHYANNTTTGHYSTQHGHAYSWTYGGNFQVTPFLTASNGIQTNATMYFRDTGKFITHDGGSFTYQAGGGAHFFANDIYLNAGTLRFRDGNKYIHHNGTDFFLSNNSGGFNFSSRPVFNGQTAWDSGNLNNPVVATYNASNIAQIDIPIPATGDNFELVISGLVALGGTGGSFGMRISLDGGASYLSASDSYAWTSIYGIIGNTIQYAGTANNNVIDACAFIGTTATQTRPSTARISILPGDPTRSATLSWVQSGVYGGYVSATGHGHGSSNYAGRITHIRMFPTNSPTNFNGKFTLRRLDT